MCAASTSVQVLDCHVPGRPGNRAVRTHAYICNQRLVKFGVNGGYTCAYSCCVPIETVYGLRYPITQRDQIIWVNVQINTCRSQRRPNCYL